jgi:sulfide:quinone oxidoreductase
MIHVCRRRRARFHRVSPLADAAGWVDVDQTTLRHKTFENIWSLGDVMNAPNAKTAAAARKQAPGRGQERRWPTWAAPRASPTMTATAPAR